jgi:cell division protein ZapA (FtsZ GTPase activity inhibitor)
METASEAPRAAAELIAQLRQEMTRLSERDNVALDERAGLMTRINALLEATDHTGREQRAAVESLVTSASAVLDQTGGQFTRMLDAQTQRASEMTDHVSASAVELAALGETFQHAVTLFNASNDKLVTSLQRVESAIGQSMERSDEQLAYYVGQAREVIDLSLSSQKAVVEDLRRLHGKQVASSESTL